MKKRAKRRSMVGFKHTVLVGVLGVSLVLSACGRRDGTPNLLNIRANTDGPDEFLVLPTEPLEMPETFAELPDPTPGGSNRTDRNPQAEAFVALGGNPAQVNQAGEGALVARTTRFGVDGNIRGELAAEDLEFRRANDGRLLERLFNVNVYYRAYEDQSLDQHSELDRFRRAGVLTPAAPPEAQ